MSKTPYYIRHIDTNATESTDGIWLDKVGEDTARRISVADFINNLPTYSSISIVAGENIVGDRAVVSIGNELFHFDITNVNHYGKCIGISKGSANIGAFVEVVISGTYTTGLTLTEGEDYYIGTSGVLTTTPPTSGIVQQIGVALTTTEFLINNTKGIIK
jgi:hypothetical protein